MKYIVLFLLSFNLYAFDKTKMEYFGSFDLGMGVQTTSTNESQNHNDLVYGAKALASYDFNLPKHAHVAAIINPIKTYKKCDFPVSEGTGSKMYFHLSNGQKTFNVVSDESLNMIGEMEMTNCSKDSTLSI